MGYVQRAAGLSGTADDALGDGAAARCQQHSVAACGCDTPCLAVGGRAGRVWCLNALLDSRVALFSAESGLSAAQPELRAGLAGGGLRAGIS